MGRSSLGRSTRGCIAGVAIGLLALSMTFVLAARESTARTDEPVAATSVKLPAFAASRVVSRDGNPTLLVDGQPFFFFGAAFFYERIPAPQWRASMLALREVGCNTLDLYVPWNWHELGDGDFDFDGHSNARRNLRGVLALARELNFKLIVRPGPVIRNEWRNGGYPAWLLLRPEYGMPLHDILEGRYPATATLQNANSDDAAAQWLNNATHMKYAGRWLQTVLREFAPVADLVVAVQLDDDQGAYIDNQTWPAPHLQAYLHTLESIVRSVVGAQLPVFINTYEMKVTASAPVWAMGNWYQSDAYTIGEHDRSALEFSTGLLQTQTHYPVAMSEFQAGWLAAPEEPAPRAVNPANTILALNTLVGLGVRGVIDFPVQDTIDPAGWEAPFANEAYLWDAALGVDLRRNARYSATKQFGDIVRNYGAKLADARRLADGAIAYLPSAYDAAELTNADVFAIAARTQSAQHDCRTRRLTCDLVDLRFTSDAALRRYGFLIVPRDPIAKRTTALARDRLTRYRVAGGRIVATAPDDVSAHTAGIADATLLLARDGTAFLAIVNYDDNDRIVPAKRLALPSGQFWSVAAFTLRAHSAQLLSSVPAKGSTAAAPSQLAAAAPSQLAAAAPSQLATKPKSTCRESASPSRTRTPFNAPRILQDDRASDGSSQLTFANDLESVTFSPQAGGRSFTFLAQIGNCDTDQNIFTSVGALRDDVVIQPPPSSTDRIGKFTRSFPAGMFNRSYDVGRQETSRNRISATLSYAAPDVVPNGARFSRTISVAADQPGFSVLEHVSFGGGPNADAQRAVRYDSFNTAGATVIDDRANGTVGFYFSARSFVAIVAWRIRDVESAALIPERTSTVLKLQFAPAPERDALTRYTFYPAADLDQARTMMLKERTAVAAKR